MKVKTARRKKINSDSNRLSGLTGNEGELIIPRKQDRLIILRLYVGILRIFRFSEERYQQRK